MKNEVLIYNQTKSRIPIKYIRKIVFRTIDLLKPKQPTELAVLVVSEKKIRNLNKNWRGVDKAVDELSFGSDSRKLGTHQEFAKGDIRVIDLGEIVINVLSVSEKNKIKEILVHSLLHLFGYSHEDSEKEAKAMEKLERKILKNLEIRI